MALIVSFLILPPGSLPRNPSPLFTPGPLGLPQPHPFPTTSPPPNFQFLHLQSTVLFTIPIPMYSRSLCSCPVSNNPATSFQPLCSPSAPPYVSLPILSPTAPLYHSSLCVPLSLSLSYIPRPNPPTLYLTLCPTCRNPAAGTFLPLRSHHRVQPIPLSQLKRAIATILLWGQGCELGNLWLAEPLGSSGDMAIPGDIPPHCPPVMFAGQGPRQARTTAGKMTGTVAAVTGLSASQGSRWPWQGRRRLGATQVG